MPSALIATPAASNANSYATLEEARAYFDDSLYAFETEELQDDDTLTRALITATQVIDDEFEFDGSPATSEQALSCPRSGLRYKSGAAIPVTVIPDGLKAATAELARQLVASELTEDNDLETQGITKIKAGPVELEFNGTANAKTIPGRVVQMLNLWARLKGAQSNVMRLVRA